MVDENFAFGLVDVTDNPKYDLVNKVRAANIAALQSLGLLGTAPLLTSAPANGATYLAGGLVPGSWAQMKGTNLSDVTRIWQDSDFAGLGNRLPTDLSGVQVLVNGTAAAVYFISPTQVSFQVPSGISGTANVQVTRDGIASNTMSAPAVSSAPGIFPDHSRQHELRGGSFPGRQDRRRSLERPGVPQCSSRRRGATVRYRAGAIARGDDGLHYSVERRDGDASAASPFQRQPPWWR